MKVRLHIAHTLLSRPHCTRPTGGVWLQDPHTAGTATDARQAPLHRANFQAIPKAAPTCCNRSSAWQAVLHHAAQTTKDGAHLQVGHTSRPYQQHHSAHTAATCSTAPPAEQPRMRVDSSLCMGSKTPPPGRP